MTTHAQSSRSNAAALKDTYSDSHNLNPSWGAIRFLSLPTLGAGTWEPGKVSMDDYFLGRLQGDSAFPLISNHANR